MPSRRKQCPACGQWPVVGDIRTPEQRAVDNAKHEADLREIAELEEYVQHLQRKIELKAQMRTRVLETLGIDPDKDS